MAFRRIILSVFILASCAFPPAARAETVHTVQKADTLSEVASTYGVRLEDLIAYNNLENPDRLSVGDKLLIPPKPGEPFGYTVRRGDSVDRIAARHGVSPAAIIQLNELDRPDSIRIGQTLLIPGDRPPPRMDPALKRALDAIRPKRSTWKYIVIHHSATKSGTLKGMDRYHRRRGMENGLAYHFVIGNGFGMPDGYIAIGQRWKKQLHGGHVSSLALNAKSIGICLVGDFNKTHPTRKQMRSLEALTSYLLKRCNLRPSAVRTHKQINSKPTQCPGRHFSTKRLLKNI